MKSKSLLMVSLLVLLATFTNFEGASAANCKKVNLVETIKSKEFTCTKVAGKLTWKLSKTGISEFSLEDPTPIPDGFSLQIADFNSESKWSVHVASGEAVLDEFGLITVTGNLLPNDTLEVKLIKGKYFRTKSYSGSAFNLQTIEPPVFAPTMTLNEDGFKILITNYDPEKFWELDSSDGSTYLDSDGYLYISNISKPGTISISIKLSGDGFKSLSKSYTYEMPEVSPEPKFSDVRNKTTSSFEFVIENFSSSYEWKVTSNAGTASISALGIVSVTGLSSNQSASITVTSSKLGARNSSAVFTNTALPIYLNLSDRDWALIAKDPVGNAGRFITVYGYITQFDAATGLNQFRADVNGINTRNAYGLTGDNTFLTGDTKLLGSFVAKDYFVAKVLVRGVKTYTTTLNGSISVPLLEIFEISRL